MRCGRPASATARRFSPRSRSKVLSPATPASPDEPFSPELAHAIHVYLARTSAILASVQIEDLLGMVDPVNVPGTYLEYPNWQRKITADIEDLAGRADLDALFADMSRARGLGDGS